MSHPFITLGLKEDASKEQVREAYLNKIRQHPPESDSVEYQELNQAYSALKDDVERAKLRLFGQMYDKESLSSILPTSYANRTRVGVNAWLTVVKEARRGR